MSRDTLNFLLNPDDYSAHQMIVLTQEYKPAFPGAIAMKTTVKPTKKTMEHPLEDGAIITDHVILMPIEIIVSMFVPSQDLQNTYDQISQYYNDSTFLIVQTRSDVYTNQYISEIPHDENPDQFNSIEIIVKFKQAQITQSQSTTTVVPKEPQNLSTVNTGVKEPLLIDSSALSQYQASAASSFGS